MEGPYCIFYLGWRVFKMPLRKWHSANTNFMCFFSTFFLMMIVNWFVLYSDRLSLDVYC